MDETTKVELARLRDENERQNRRLDMVEHSAEMQRNIELSVEKLDINMEQMLKMQERLSERLDALERAPGEQWSSMKRTIFNTVVGAGAGAFATGIIYMMGQYIR